MSATALTTEEARPASAPLRRFALVLAVAYMLVLQALLGGLASGAHAAGSLTVDAFGQTLCLGARGDPAAPANPSSHPPDCCTTGCQTAVTPSLLPPTAATAALPVAHRLARQAPPRPARLARAPERSPRHARAPPRA